MPWPWLLIGVTLGAALAAPAAWLLTQRTWRRLHAAEDRARSQRRLAELGTMTGGLAHEIKNPLSTINLNAQLIHEDLAALLRQPNVDPDEAEQIGRVQRRLQTMIRETQRLRDTLEAFLKFAGRIQLDRQPTNVNELVEDLADFVEPQAQQAGVRLRLQLQADPPTAAVDPALLKQALLNLVINALQAMEAARAGDQPHGGATDLILRTENARGPHGPEIALHVTDTGPGIPPDHQPRIFEPYFSTKRAGTGLGLPTTRRIIEEHAGSITVHTTPGTGTDFTLTLPRDAGEDQAPA